MKREEPDAWLVNVYDSHGKFLGSRADTSVSQSSLDAIVASGNKYMLVPLFAGRLLEWDEYEIRMHPSLSVAYSKQYPTGTTNITLKRSRIE